MLGTFVVGIRDLIFHIFLSATIIVNPLILVALRQAYKVKKITFIK